MLQQEATVTEIVDRVLDSPLVAEIIVIDDGSTDGTRAKLACLHDPRVRFILQPFNQGKGAAVRCGIAAATVDYGSGQAADLEYDPAEYPRLVGPLLDGRADAVSGTRSAGGSDRRVLYYWRTV